MKTVTTILKNTDLGTPLALTDEQGQLLWEASPDDWAAVSNQQGSASQPIRYQGQYQDEESGLYYNRHRYYDPQLGRYVNQDPIGLRSGEPNHYSYPKNPVQRTDPLGLFVPLVLHWGRNFFNEDLNGRDINDLVDGANWEVLPQEKNIYHTQRSENLSCNSSAPKNNQKVISPSGRSEYIFDGSGQCVVTDDINKGTYNYFSPNMLWGIPHVIADVIPYYVLGNSPSDMFTTDRFKTTWSLFTD